MLEVLSQRAAHDEVRVWWSGCCRNSIRASRLVWRRSISGTLTLIRRGVLPDPVSSPGEPPHDWPSESGMTGATTFFADNGVFFWMYRDLFGTGGNYPAN
ncbi:hypothetical protein ACWF9G_04015 [Nocardia sp. NPDC055029]